MNLLVNDCIKKIKNTFGRFLSILIIVALGTGFFIGINSVSYDMTHTMDNFFDKNNLMDLKVVSNVGLTNNMINKLKYTNDINVYPSYSLDTLYKDKVVRIHSISDVNKMELIKGRMPNKEGECIAVSSNFSIGDKITLKTDNSILKNKEYKVVGVGNSPLYITNEKGTSQIGNGKIDSYIYILENNFINNLYTEAYITSKSLKKLNTYSNEYKRKIEGLKKQIEKIELESIYKEDMNKIYSNSLSYVPNKNIEIYTLTREDNIGYSDYKSDTERVDKIATVFPLFFILVAALVCLNTMVRFIEEEREEIGLLKSLGYSNIKIIFIYLLYGFISSTLGALIGTSIGYYVFPSLIYDIYKFTYTLPNLEIYKNIALSCIVVLIFITLILIITVYSCYNSLKEEPAILLRPKSPKVGKKVFIENMKFIWNKLNFTNKVTMRNIFRYKKRIFMVIVGVGGSTALLLTALGLRDSIAPINDIQYKDIFKYDSILILNEGVKGLDNNIKNTLEKNNVKNYSLLKQENYIFKKNDKKNTFNLMLVDDEKEINKYFSLYGKKLSNDGVIITNKMASLLSLKKGDTFIFENTNGKKYSVKISDITDNYIYHYMYISKEYYNKILGDISYNSIINTLENNTNSIKFSKNILKSNYFLNVILKEDITKNFNTMIISLNKIVIILTLVALILSFVVLYNLTIINIIERKREVATLKVLGFYDIEVSNYIYKETMILTFIGSIVGLFMGILLHSFVMKNAEMDTILFPKQITMLSYILSVLLIMLFNFIIGIFMHFKLKKIDMISSLKSTE